MTKLEIAANLNRIFMLLTPCFQSFKDSATMQSADMQMDHIVICFNFSFVDLLYHSVIIILNVSAF